METSSPSHHAQKIMAFKKVHADFKDIMKQEKCRTCACFYGDVLSSIYDKIKRFQETESDRVVSPIKHDFERWLQEADLLKAHG